MDGQLLAGSTVRGEPGEREAEGGPDIADTGLAEALMQLIDHAAQAEGEQGH